MVFVGARECYLLSVVAAWVFVGVSLPRGAVSDVCCVALLGDRAVIAHFIVNRVTMTVA